MEFDVCSSDLATSPRSRSRRPSRRPCAASSANQAEAAQRPAKPLLPSPCTESKIIPTNKWGRRFGGRSGVHHLAGAGAVGDPCIRSGSSSADTVRSCRAHRPEIERATGRESVGKYVEFTVGPGAFKQKNSNTTDVTCTLRKKK